jgi:RimJ/RimL family protein N-acetyltransferase
MGCSKRLTLTPCQWLRGVRDGRSKSGLRSDYLVTVPAQHFEPRELDLEDGTRVHIRPIAPEDEPLLHEAVAAMSERSVYFRFFSPLKRLPEALAHRLAVVDQKDRFALVATANKPTGKERILGVARYDRVTGTDVAEVAVAVVDEVQHRGLGGALLAILARAAREHGIKTFTLIVLPENQQMLGLLRKMGWIHHAKLSGGVYDISFDLPEI